MLSFLLLLLQFSAVRSFVEFVEFVDDCGLGESINGMFVVNSVSHVSPSERVKPGPG